MKWGAAGFHMKRILGKKVGVNKGKLANQQPLIQPPIKCPECTSQHIWKDGVRQTKHGDVQRWLCRSCGHRFSDLKVKVNVVKQSSELSDSMLDFGDLNLVDISVDEVGLQDSAFAVGENVCSHNLSTIGKAINNFLPNSRERQCMRHQVGATKNMATVETRLEKAAGATELNEAEIKGVIVEHTFWLLREGYRETTAIHRGRLLRTLLRQDANLFDGDSVKETIANMKIQDGTKLQYVAAYATFCIHRGLKWKPPKYRQTEKIPFIPTEEEINQLITACTYRKTATLLQALKETAMRIGEAWRLKWIDIDLERNTLTLNLPEKRSNARIFRISPKLKQMLLALPNHEERVFGYVNLNNTKHTYLELRKRIAKRLQNPRILRITYHTFRHWKATMEYHHTKDIIHVMKFLGHRDIRNTMRYIDIANHVFKYKADEYTTRVAANVKGARALLEAGFEYIMDRDGVMIFRKRK